MRCTASLNSYATNDKHRPAASRRHRRSNASLPTCENSTRPMLHSPRPVKHSTGPLLILSLPSQEERRAHMASWRRPRPSDSWMAWRRTILRLCGPLGCVISSRAAVYAYHSSHRPPRHGWSSSALKVESSSSPALPAVASTSLEVQAICQPRQPFEVRYPPSSLARSMSTRVRIGLAEVLRNEFVLYGIDIHCYLPGGIDSPGYAAEQEGKPQITVDIEGSDTLQSGAACAKGLIAGASVSSFYDNSATKYPGLERGQFLITTDFLGALFRANTTGVSPRSTFFTDLFLGIIGPVRCPSLCSTIVLDAGTARLPRLAPSGRSTSSQLVKRSSPTYA